MNMKFIRMVNKTMPAAAAPGAMLLCGYCGIDFTAGEKYVQEWNEKLLRYYCIFFSSWSRYSSPLSLISYISPSCCPSLPGGKPLLWYHTR